MAVKRSGRSGHEVVAHGGMLPQHASPRFLIIGERDGRQLWGGLPRIHGEALVVPDSSTIYFPLRSNASALFAGPGVASVRRRILTAALLNDQVVLEDGFHVAWAGPAGGSTITAHGDQSAPWQTPRQRGRATGAQHYVAMRPDDAPETAPFRAVVMTEATFSWRPTFEPFRRELPASAARWLSFGHVTDDGPAKDIIRGWESSDRIDEWRRYRNKPRPEPPGGQFVHSAILDAGYHDLAVAATAQMAISIDRRHRLAIDARLRAGDAQPLGGHYALGLLLPTKFAWQDVPDLRRDRSLRDYRAIVREIESEALRTGRSAADIDDRIRREYQDRLGKAAAKGIPFAGRVGLQAVGFILGAAADTAAPVIGGATVASGAFVAGELLSRAMRPRWLAVDRRLSRGRRNGL